jgi:hypothetical protein
MNVSARRKSGPTCVHQCTKCGLIYHCGEARCGKPFYSGVCAQSAAFAHKTKTLFALT